MNETALFEARQLERLRRRLRGMEILDAPSATGKNAMNRSQGYEYAVFAVDNP
jgi:hypothetical protein